ncbi:SH3 domain-containing protein [Helicobacter sp.]|uniref:SH3 domain-containing protein n=1 Tax=Helicobacter sp. TaxID=218 RepID=UPI0025C20A57|nr:SH3 domain-containing protein [Helicobacter sp.]MCI5632499.1 SH3 domain-containing protein [Helicobacter sp.]
MRNIIAIFLALGLCFGMSAFGETRLFPQATPNPDTSNPELQQEQTPQNSLPNAIIESDIESQNVELQSSDSIQYANKSLVKNVYLETLTPLLDILYVHQVVALEVKMLIFSGYTTIETEFLFEDNALKNSVEVLNPKQNWVINTEDSSLKNTFYLKINQVQFAIPTIKVSVNTKEGTVSETLTGHTGRAIKLDRKGSYAQVVAESLEILDTKITNYDANHNLAVLQLKSKMGNLFDFHLSAYAKQGIESKSGNYKEATAFYYAIVPKEQNTISFDYFNTQVEKYQTLQVQNIAIEDRVSTQSDIKPKNNYQFFKISLMVFFALLFFGLYLYKRKIIFIMFLVIALAFLLYFVTLKTSVILKSNVALRIQPTFNSTIVLTTHTEQKAEILGKRNNYYKVILEDEHIGWVVKNDIKD